MRESISRSIGDVRRQIAGVDENLAGLFGGIAERIIMAKDRYKGERPSYPISGKVVEDILRDIRGGGRINTIPFGEPTRECLEECLAVALRSFKSSDTFSKVVGKVKNYWLSCGEVNCCTLIVTDNWDKYVFYRDHKESFDIYTSKTNRNNIKHTVAVVLLGDYGFSLQYLK